MWCSSWTSLHYKYMAATWIEPAFSIIHLAAWLSHPKQDIIAVHALLLPACHPVKVPLVGLIKLDLIWNDQCGLSRPRVVIFISLKYFIFSYTPLFVGLLLSCRQYSWRCEDLSDPKTFSCSTRCLKNATSSRCASQQPIVLAQKNNMLRILEWWEWFSPKHTVFIASLQKTWHIEKHFGSQKRRLEQLKWEKHSRTPTLLMLHHLILFIQQHTV